MVEISKLKIGEDFRPSIKLRNLYYTYLLLILVFGILSWYLPTLVVIYFFSPQTVKMIVTAITIIPIAFILIFAVYWIPNIFRQLFIK